VKRISAHIFFIILSFTLVLPGLAIAQRAQQTPSGSTSSESNPGSGLPARGRPTRGASPKTAAVERDFDEALKLVQEQYVDGRKLNYNDVFKSSIIGMLRSLDPHSNYYDRDEFDE
jgi:C-terminal processing protease CtpA/Prc